MSRKKMPAIVPNFRFKTFSDFQTYRSTWSAQKRPWRLFSAICEGKTGLRPEPAADVPRVSGGLHRPDGAEVRKAGALAKPGAAPAFSHARATRARSAHTHARTLLDKYVLTGEVKKPNKK